jgi:hypothetical protein
MDRATARLGWGNGVFAAPVLNSVYTHGQFWVPIGSMTPGIEKPFTLETYEIAQPNRHTYTVGKFPEGVEAEAFWTWAFKTDFVNAISLSLKIAPLWFLKTADAGKVVKWEANAFNTIINSGTLDFQNDANEYRILSPCIAVNRVACGDATSNQRGIGLITIGSDAMTNTGWNFLSLGIERHGDEVGDTCVRDAYLLGAAVQFACDFGNIAAWPVTT